MCQGGHLRKPVSTRGDVVGTLRSFVATIFSSKSEITEKEGGKCIVRKLHIPQIVGSLPS